MCGVTGEWWCGIACIVILSNIDFIGCRYAGLFILYCNDVAYYTDVMQADNSETPSTTISDSRSPFHKKVDIVYLKIEVSDV